MGGQAITMAIERLAAGQGSEPLALHTALWVEVDRIIRDGCTHDANDQVLVDYLGSSAYEGLHGRRDSESRRDWPSSETELWFSFGDAAGMCNMSMVASLHWIQVALAAHAATMDQVAGEHGFRIVSPRPSLGELLREGPYYPLLEVESVLYCVPRFGRGRLDYEDEWGGLFSDDGLPRPTLAGLSEADRARAVRAAITGACGCQLCLEVAPPPADAGGDEAVLPGLWLRLAEDGDAKGLCEAAGAAMRAFSDAQWAEQPSGPPALQVLRDFCEERSLLPPPAALVGLVLHFSSGR